MSTIKNVVRRSLVILLAGLFIVTLASKQARPADAQTTPRAPHQLSNYDIAKHEMRWRRFSIPQSPAAFNRQFNCLRQMWNRESGVGWSTTAGNPGGAYGIPQALPGSKMASAGPHWRTSPWTQIKWGLWYIKNRYGTPCGAWAFWQGHSWY